jgi:hypothetical protein
MLNYRAIPQARLLLFVNIKKLASRAALATVRHRTKVDIRNRRTACAAGKLSAGARFDCPS